ncbi:MAG TPA: hypothetical protein VLM75_10490 [Spirochaetota bacterium]|nr:hypothetical protein [Spirochaetota bacterium]
MERTWHSVPKERCTKHARGGGLAALFSRNTTWRAALAGMPSGTVVLVVWKSLGLGTQLYEIVPGFAANVAAIIIVNRFTCNANDAARREFDEVESTVRNFSS